MPRNTIIFFCLLVLISLRLSSQDDVVFSSSVDTTKIKIGEKIDFQLDVILNQGLNFILLDSIFSSPFEIIETFKLDTLKNNNIFKLSKKYSITSFEAGSYYIKPKKIDINGKIFESDSILIEVASVKVDTVSKKFFDIKEIIQVNENKKGWWIKYLIGLILIIVVVLLFKIFQKFQSNKAIIQKQDPIEKAIIALKKLESKNLKEQLDYKNYYSSLTEIVKNYFEEDISMDAFESTSEELINKLESLKGSGKLSLGSQTISEFRKVLETADLVKFAKTNPGSEVAFSDKKVLEKILMDTKQSIPEPTEEELLKDKQYAESQKRKKRNILIKKGLQSVIILLLTSFIVSVILFGWQEVSDTVFGNQTKSLLNKTWVNSKYGAYPIQISTPNVLSRQKSETTLQTFKFGSIEETLYLVLDVGPSNQNQNKVSKQKILDEVIANLKDLGATNILTKDERYITSEGKTCLKVFGSFDYEFDGVSVKKEYINFRFAENNGIQNILSIYDRQNLYTAQIMERINNSIKF